MSSHVRSRTVSAVSDRSTARPVEHLIECCRAFLDGRVLSVPDDVDASRRFRRLAVWHGIAPVVARVLGGPPGDTVADGSDGWAEFLRSTSSYNRLLLGELKEIVDECRVRGVPVVAFKGPVLAGRAYGDVCLRQYYDLDLLTAPDALEPLEALLEGRGYRPARSLGEIRRSLFLYFERQMPYVRGERTLKVDVHTGLAPRRFLPAETASEYHDRSVRDVVEGESIPVFALPDALIAACLHGAKHRWEALRLILDVAALAREASARDWVRLRERSQGEMDPRLVRVGLALAREIVHADLPEEVVRWMSEDGVIAEIVGRVRDRLPRVHRRSEGRLRRIATHLKMRERWDWRLYYLTGVFAHNSWSRSLWAGEAK